MINLFKNQRGFADRGDPASIDFATGNFIKDGVWRDWDLSSIVPAGAKEVKLSIIFRQTVINTFQLRKNGNSNGINSATGYVIVINEIHSREYSVALDTNRIIEYAISSGGTWNIFNVVVKSWLF